MSTHEVHHEKDGAKGRFYIGTAKKALAETTYSMAGEDKLIVDHTWVDDSLRGQGAGEALVLSLVDFARELKISVIPLCPFARSVFSKKDDIRDVLN